MTDTHSHIIRLVQQTLSRVDTTGKAGRRTLQPGIAAALRAAGFNADEEDKGLVMATGMYPWRAKETGLPEPTASRRRIDVVVYHAEQPIAFIETESDLDDLRPPGTTNRRNGHYDVHSIAKGVDGKSYESYKSLERMAAAAFYWAHAKSTGTYPSPQLGLTLLEAIRSNGAPEHNPAGLLLVLVSGRCRTQDPAILAPRLNSLGAHLLCGS